MLLMFSACGSRNHTTKVVLTTGFARDEVFKIENMSCRVPEILLYLVTVKNQYAETFGEEIFQVSLDPFCDEKDYITIYGACYGAVAGSLLDK